MIRLILAICLGCSVAFAEAEQTPTAPAPVVAPEQTQPTDTVAEQHLLRQMFDQAYDPTKELDASQTPQWAEWEEVFFNQYKCQQKLEKLIAKNWSIGHTFWEAHVDIEYDWQSGRGGPIYFVVDYPLIDWRDNLKFAVMKNGDGKTIAKIVGGAYHTPRLSYIQSMVPMIMILLTITVIIVTFAMGILKLWNVIAGFLAAELVKDVHNPAMEKLARKFINCVMGAIICILIAVIWAVKVL